MNRLVLLFVTRYRSLILEHKNRHIVSRFSFMTRMLNGFLSGLYSKSEHTRNSNTTTTIFGVVVGKKLYSTSSMNYCHHFFPNCCTVKASLEYFPAATFFFCSSPSAKSDVISSVELSSSWSAISFASSVSSFPTL